MIEDFVLSFLSNSIEAFGSNFFLHTYVRLLNYFFTDISIDFLSYKMSSFTTTKMENVSSLELKYKNSTKGRPKLLLSFN